MSRLTQMARLVAVGIIGGTIAIAIPGCAPTRSSAKVLYAAPAGSGAACSHRYPCSLVGAQQRVRRMLATTEGKTRDIVMELADGTYRLAAPLRFGPRDSGRNGHAVIWTAAPGAHPVISGGTRVTGWAESDPAEGIWSAKVPAGTRTRQLYVDGKAAQMAQANLGELGLDLSHWNATGFVVSGATAKYFSRLAAHADPRQIRGLEMVWSPMPPTDWEASECPVASIGAGIIRMAEPCWKNLTARPATIWGAGNNNVNPYELRAGSAPTAILGARSLLTQPGQWYLGPAAHTVYYKPMSGQNMAKVDVEVPRLQALLQVTGTLAHPVHDLVFRGLTFTTTTWLQPSTHLGFVQVQANLHITGASNQGECRFTTPPGSCPWGGFAQPPGAVTLTAAHRITLRDDKFVDLGAVGVEVKYGSDDNLIQGNMFTRIASSAIWLGCSGDPDPLDSSADPAASIIASCAADPASASEDVELAGSEREIMTGNTVDDNVIHHVGYGYLGAAGITLMFTRHSTISHNDVFDVPYDGLTSGAWQGHPDNQTIGPTHRTDVTTNINADNAIVDNYFHNNMKVFTGDGGNIYTEGHQGRTLRHRDGSVDTAASYAHGLRISGNLFNADPPGNRAYSIAPDVGSQWIEATGNAEWGFKYSFSCHWPSDVGSELKYTGNWRSDPDDSHCPTDVRNTTMPSHPGPADVPLAVLAHAGVQGRYQKLEAALPAVVDYSEVSPASGSTPAEILVTGSGFTRSTAVYVGGVMCPHLRFVSPGVLVAVVPPDMSIHAPVTVRRRPSR
ncbi:MAG: hypothetical protein ACREPY_01690 [Rhodanobacteraceae bacterium]